MMTFRQQRSGVYAVGQYRSHAGMIVIQAADRWRELTYQATDFKTFNSRQGAARWRDYRLQSGVGDDLSACAVIPLPIPQDD